MSIKNLCWQKSTLTRWCQRSKEHRHIKRVYASQRHLASECAKNRSNINRVRSGPHECIQTTRKWCLNATNYYYYQRSPRGGGQDGQIARGHARTQRFGIGIPPVEGRRPPQRRQVTRCVQWPERTVPPGAGILRVRIAAGVPPATSACRTRRRATIKSDPVLRLADQSSHVLSDSAQGLSRFAPLSSS